MSDQSVSALSRRKRLSTACDRCRHRKQRCDDAVPVCSNCSRAGAECITRDLRQPHVPVQRREAQGGRRKRHKPGQAEVRELNVFHDTNRSDTCGDGRIQNTDITLRQDGQQHGSHQDRDRNSIETEPHPEDEFHTGITRNQDFVVSSGLRAESVRSVNSVQMQTSLTPHVNTSHPSIYIRRSGTKQPVPSTESEDFDGLSTEPLPLIPRFSSGSSLSVLTQWLDLAFARLGMPERFSAQYRNHKPKPFFDSDGKSATSSHLRSIRDASNKAEIARFMDTVNQVFPILGESEVVQGLGLLRSQSNVSDLFYHLVLTAGSQAYSEVAYEQRSQSLAYAFSVLAEVIQDDTISSVHVLILMSLLFRAHDKLELASQMLANAVARALAIGLDKKGQHFTQAQGHGLQSQQLLRSNTWWSLFVLDKVLAVELQRPPMVHSHLHEQEPPSQNDHNESDPSSRSCFVAIIELSKIQERVCDSLLEATHAESSGRTSLYEAVNDKIRISGELDQILRHWAEDLPFGLRPAEYVSCSVELLPAVSFLAIQYYQTLFLVHRNSLIVNPKATQARIETHFKSASWRHRSLRGAALCGNMARSIVNILGRLSEVNKLSPLISTYASLISIYALAIIIVKTPSGESAKIDLEIQASAIRSLERLRPREDLETFSVYTMVKGLHAQLAARVNSRISTVETSVQQLSDTTLVSQTTRPTGIKSSTASVLTSDTIGRGQGQQDADSDRSPAMSYYDFFNDPIDLDAFDIDACALAYDLPS